MCWEDLAERDVDAVAGAERHDLEKPRADEVDWPTVERKPVEEPVEAGDELARV